MKNGLGNVSILDGNGDEQFIWSKSEAKVGKRKLQKSSELVADFDEGGGGAGKDDTGNGVDDGGNNEDIEDPAFDQCKISDDRADRQQKAEGQTDDAGKPMWQVESWSKPFEALHLFHRSFHLFYFVVFSFWMRIGDFQVGFIEEQTRPIR